MFGQKFKGLTGGNSSAPSSGYKGIEGNTDVYVYKYRPEKYYFYKKKRINLYLKKKIEAWLGCVYYITRSGREYNGIGWFRKEKRFVFNRIRGISQEFVQQ